MPSVTWGRLFTVDPAAPASIRRSTGRSHASFVAGGANSFFGVSIPESSDVPLCYRQAVGPATWLTTQEKCGVRREAKRLRLSHLLPNRQRRGAIQSPVSDMAFQPARIIGKEVEAPPPADSEDG